MKKKKGDDLVKSFRDIFVVTLSLFSILEAISIPHLRKERKIYIEIDMMSF